MFGYVKKLQRGERAESERDQLRAAADKATVTIVFDSRGKVVAAR